MTVAELIEELRGMEPDLEVKFTYNYGDRGRTQVAQPVLRVEDGFTKSNDYFRMDVVVDSDDEEKVAAATAAVLLS